MIATTAVLAVAGFSGRAAGAEDWAASFASPPAANRILRIIHEWPGQPKAQVDFIGRLQRQGFGGVVCNVAHANYLESETNWSSFVRAVGAAKQAGMALWLYDERGYPSANAGGIVLRDHPEWRARGLLIADARTSGTAVSLDQPPGQLVLTAAFPVRAGKIDRSGKMDLSGLVRDRKLAWQPPAGEWHVMLLTEDELYEGTHAEMGLADHIPYPNLLMPEPTARFIEVTHGRYARHLGDDLGKYFISTFTDEPSLMSLFLRPMPYRVLPWAPGLPEAFRRQHGYDLAPIVPELIADGPESARHRYAFWNTIGALVSENFFGQIQQWCARHNVRSGGHLLMEESLVALVPLYGDFFRCIRRLDAPSIDCLTSVPAQVPWQIARVLSGAAELEGKSVVMSETSDHSQHYRAKGDTRPRQTVSEGEIRGTCNRQMVAGVNAITSYYSFTDLSDEQLRRLNEWVGRCSYLLTGGHHAADIALLYPVESLWPRFRPARHFARESPEADLVEHSWRDAAEALFAARRDFTMVDSRALAEGRVEGDRLVHGKLSWRVIVLPHTDTLPLKAWQNLRRFVREGGVVIAAGALPANSENAFPSAEVQAIARDLFGEVRGEMAIRPNDKGGFGIYLSPFAEGLLVSSLSRVLEPEGRVATKGATGGGNLRLTHRVKDGRHLFFLINDAAARWEGTVTFSGAESGRRWDPATGAASPISGGSLMLAIEPYGAVFCEFPQLTGTARLRPKNLGLSGLSEQPLPLKAPEVVQGEHVRARLECDGESGGARWRSSATLAKGNVDTFLFLRFFATNTVDLSGAACLLLDTTVPVGQRTPSQLLVILREKGGGDFIAHTGRPLSIAGPQRVIVPFHRLQLAGWSKDADGQLDLSKVDEVRVGWGGYLGAEGERVEFSVAWPKAGIQ